MVSLPITFLKILIIFFLFQLFGATFLKLFDFKIKGNFFRLFIKQLTGLCISIFFIAVFFTGGKTIMLGFLFIALGFIFRKRKDFQIVFLGKREFWKGIIDKKVILQSLLGLLSIFLIEFFLFFPEKNVVALPHMDYIYYSRISKFLTTFGIESNLPEFIFPETVNPIPYHYVELWLNSGISLLFRGNHLLNLFLITIPYGLFLTWVGLIALAESLNNSKPLTWIIAFAVLFFIGLMIPGVEKIYLFQETQNFIHNPWNYPKLLPIFWFFIPALISIIYKRPQHAILFLSSLIIAYVSVIPGIIGTLAIWFACHLFFSNFMVLKENLWAILAILFYPVFYLFFSNSNSPITENFDFSLFSNPTYWRTAINIAGKTIIQVSLLFLPVFILFFANVFNQRSKKTFLLKDQKELWGFLILPITFSLLAWAIFHPLLDSMQFFANLNGVIMLISFFVLTIFLLDSKGISKYPVLLFFFLFVGLGINKTINYKGSLSNERIQWDRLQATGEKLKGKNPVGVFLLSEDQFNSIFEKKPFVFGIGQELSLISPDFQLISLSVFNAPMSETDLYYETELSIQRSSTFYKFVEKQKEKGGFSSIGKSQVDFIREYKIEFLVCEPNFIIPENIKKTQIEILTLQKNNELLLFLGKDNN